MTYWRLFYHLVWSTRRRELVIDNQIEAIVRRSINGLAAEKGASIDAIGVMPNHVHVALSIPPKYAISEVVNSIKGASSHPLGHELRNPERPWPSWQSEYGVLSFRERSRNGVIDYLNNQRQHHAANSLIRSMEREDRDRVAVMSNGNGKEESGPAWPLLDVGSVES